MSKKILQTSKLTSFFGGLNKLTYTTAIVLGLFLISAKSANAVNYYWVGGSTNSVTSNTANWNTSPGPCADSGNVTLPGSSDAIIFDSSCTNDATVDSNLSVGITSISDGYTGTITVDSADMSVNGQLTVNGNLSIVNAGTVTVSSGNQIIIGNATDDEGTITVNGTGSQLNNSNARIRVGNAGTGHLVIQNGAIVTTGNTYVGYGPGSVGTVTVDGAGSVWNTDQQGGLGYIGRQAEGSLTISNGGVVNTLAAPWQIGGLAGSTGTVEVTGSGSQLNMTGDNVNLRVGYSSTGSLTVNDGGVVSVEGVTSKITLADQAGSSGTLTIGSGYTMDQISTTDGVFTGAGTYALPPSAPSNLDTSSISTTSIDWDWDDVASATGYNTYNSTGDTLLATVSTSNWSQTSLSSSTSYSIYIRSSNDQGIGYASAQVSATTLTPSTSSNNSAPSQSMPSAPTCSNRSPIGTTDLFQIDREGKTSTLYFTPVNDDVEGYNVMFGFFEGDEHFGGIGIPAQNENQGVQSLIIDHLDPDVAYYFKVIPVNGCATGSWSNWLKADKIIGNQSIFYRYFPLLNSGQS